MLSSQSLLLAVVGFAAVSYASPARKTTYMAAAPTATMPAHCTTTSGLAVSTHSCYSYTTRVTPRGGCPREECPPETEPVFCPLFIVESTITVPCSTDCCPTTGTTTVTTPCPKPCEKCPIPTNYNTVTAACSTLK